LATNSAPLLVQLIADPPSKFVQVTLSGDPWALKVHALGAVPASVQVIE
jgi:hypothetical protein